MLLLVMQAQDDERGRVGVADVDQVVHRGVDERAVPRDLGDRRSGEQTALRSGMQATRPIVEPVGERRPVWWMFAALSRAMGRASPGGVDPDALTDEDYLRGVLAHSSLAADDVFTAGPRGIETPAEYGWVHDDLLPDGRWAIAPAALLDRLAAYADPVVAGYLLAPRREMAWSNSVAYGAAADLPVVRMNGEGGAGIVALSTQHGHIAAPFVTDEAVREGVVSITHGHAGANPGDLTSGDEAVDDITAMPRIAGLDVEITRVLADADEHDGGSTPS